MIRNLLFAFIALGALTAGGLLAAVPAYAQDADSSTSSAKTGFEEIKTKTTSKLEEWRMSLESVTVDAFDAHQAKKPVMEENDKESSQGEIIGWTIVMGLLHIAKIIVTTAIVFYVVAAILIVIIVRGIYRTFKTRNDPVYE